MSIKDYFSSLFKGIWSLIKGMQVTAKELVTPKVTEQYPENRATLKIADRFRATLEFAYDEAGNHKCIACGLCQMNCPNGTIKIESKMVETADGKKKRKLEKYMYDLGSCTFCMLCVQSCSTKAIRFSNDFEQAVYTREKLVKQLNYLPEKEEEPAPAPKPAAEAAPAPAPAAPAANPKVIANMKTRAGIETGDDAAVAMKKLEDTFKKDTEGIKAMLGKLGITIDDMVK